MLKVFKKIHEIGPFPLSPKQLRLKLWKKPETGFLFLEFMVL